MSSDALRRSSQAYDQQLLLKIGGSAGQASPATNAHEPAVDLQNTLSRLNGQLLNLSKFSRTANIQRHGFAL